MLVHDEGHVTSVAVDPSAQGAGIAARLLATVHRGMIQLGAVAMTLEVRTSNRRAQDLYRGLGYAPAGVRKNYYSDGRGESEDALVMWCQDVREDPHLERLRSVEEAYISSTIWETP